MDGTGAVDVAVASDRALVAEAIAAALASASGHTVVQVPWAATTLARPVWEVMVEPPTMTIVLCDLEPGTLGPAQRMVHAYPDRCFLLTDAPRGPAWGAMLEAGVIGILPSSITLVDLLAVIDEFLAGRYDGTLADHDALVGAWAELRQRRTESLALIATLTERELDVLRLLRTGMTVRQIAQQRGVSPSTVRSQVRAILRKLKVHAQLAAVAVLARAEAVETGTGHRPPTPQDWG